MRRGATSTPTRIQAHAAECGAVCLGIVLERHGVVLPAVTLRALCGVTRDGSSIRNIAEGARHLGFDCAIYKKGLAKLHDNLCPAIVHWSFRHFVVLERIGETNAWINDPAVGRRRVPIAEFSDHYTGVILTVTPTERVTAWARKPSIWKSLPDEIKNLRFFCYVTIAPALILFSLEFAFGALSRIFFDYVVQYELVTWGFWISLLGAVLILVNLGLSAFFEGQNLKVGTNCTMRLRQFFLERLLDRNPKFFAEHFPGEIYQRSVEFEHYSRFWFNFFSDVSRATLFAVGSGALVFVVSPLIGTVNLVPFVFVLAATWVVRYRTREFEVRLQQEQGRYLSTIMQRLESFERFYASGTLGQAVTSCIAGFLRTQSARSDQQRFFIWYDAVTGLLDAMLTPVTTFLGAYLLIANELTFGGLAFVTLMAGLFVRSLGELADLFKQLVEIDAVTARAAEVIDRREAAVPTAGLLSGPSAAKAPPPARPSVPDPEDTAPGGLFAMRGVAYGFSGAARPVFSGLTLEIAPGEVFCFVGDSGSGKTTCLEVLSGQRPPTEGVVFYGGEPLEDRAPCGFVFPDDDFVTGTVPEFVAGFGEVDHDRVKELLELVELERRLGFFVEGDHAFRLSKETLSRGEIQRLMLAMALYRSRECVIFDEAFSHVALEQSARILERLRASGTTMVLASHRPEIQGISDRIFRLQGD